MDTQRKITEGSDQVYDTNYYTPLQEPIVSSTANKVKLIVNKLYVNKHIDETTFKWLNNSQNPPRIPEFYTLTKIHKPNLAGRPIVSLNGGPIERISSFIDSLLQPIAKKQESYIKDTTDFVRFIENTPIPENAIIATLDVCSLYTNIPQEKGIEVVCNYYNDHYQPNPPIPTSTLGDLMKLILKENSFHFNGKHFLQTHGIAMGTKMAVAFSVIFMAHVEKQLLLSSPHKPIIWKRLRTNAIKEKSESSKRDFKFRLLERGYPQKLVNNIQAEVDFSSRNNTLKYKPKTSKNILPLVTTYNPGVPKLKESLMKNWSLISNNPNLARIFPNAPIVAYKKDKSLKDLLVRAKIPPQP